MGWRDLAACADTDPEQWFHDSATDESKRICRGCPVITDCLAWALDNGCTHGVWAATTGVERARILERRTGRPTAARPVDPQRVADVWRLTQQGVSAKQIAEQLGMHQRVVVRYRKRARALAAQ